MPNALSWRVYFRLLEELVPFMDHGINDPKALQMSSSHHRRKQPAAKVCIKVHIAGQLAMTETLQQG